jgi:hypothetical protein
MIKVTVGTATERQELIVEETETPKSVLDQAEVVFTVAQIYLDGIQLGATDMAKPLSELTDAEEVRLIVVVKTNNN